MKNMEDIQSKHNPFFSKRQNVHVNFRIMVCRSIYPETAVTVFFLLTWQKEMISFLAAEKGDVRSSFES